LSSHAESNPERNPSIAGSDAGEKSRILFSDTDLDRFIPPAYRDILMGILANDSLPAEDTSALDDLRATLESENIEIKIASIITEIMKIIPFEEQGDGIRRNLEDLTSFFLESADFKAVAYICKILVDNDRERAEQTMFNPGFIQKVLDSAHSQGRDCYREIRSIISMVGHPFVSPLIDRMAEEENRALRRFWFDCLGDLGDMVREPALERLNDERWYVVRNLLILLRSFSDDEVKRQIRRFAGSPHIRVRSEALRNLLHYHDSNADRLLLQDLASANASRVLAAVQNAEMSRNPEVGSRLLAILESSGYKHFGLDVKCAAVQSLVTSGNPHALARFTTILHSSSLLNAGKLNQLKIEIIRVLPRYPVAQVKPILLELSSSGRKAIAEAASESFKHLLGGTT
jgi:HEAT repeat protein